MEGTYVTLAKMAMENLRPPKATTRQRRSLSRSADRASDHARRPPFALRRAATRVGA